MNTERIVAGLVDRVERRYFGKYRGFVVENDDPQHLGRITVRVPSVLGRSVVTGWAMPCVPYGGAADRGMLFVPEPKSGVWVEFEEGDLEFPIWVGTFWSAPDGTSELPVPNGADGSSADAPQAPPTRKILKTAKGHTLQFEDADKSAGITLVDGVNGHVVVLSADGISITDGVHDGNTVVLDAKGVTIHDKNGNAVVLASGGIRLGGSNEHMVLGDTLQARLSDLLQTLNSHTHAVSSLGSPTGPASPPGPPFTLDVPLSTRQTLG